MLHNLFGALTGIALMTLGVGPTTPPALEAKAESKHNGHGHGHGHHHGHHHGHGHGHGHHCDEVDVAGSFTVEHNGPPSVTPVAPDLCIIELDPSFVFVGDLEGSFTSTFVIEHAGACDQPAAEYFSTDGTWSGSVVGSEGSFAYTFEGTIDEQGIASGEFIVIEGSGTGALEDIEGSLSLTGLAGVEGTYEGTLEF